MPLRRARHDSPPKGFSRSNSRANFGMLSRGLRREPSMHRMPKISWPTLQARDTLTAEGEHANDSFTSHLLAASNSHRDSFTTMNPINARDPVDPMRIGKSIDQATLSKSKPAPLITVFSDAEARGKHLSKGKRGKVSPITSRRLFPSFRRSSRASGDPTLHNVHSKRSSCLTTAPTTSSSLSIRLAEGDNFREHPKLRYLAGEDMTYRRGDVISNQIDDFPGLSRSNLASQNKNFQVEVSGSRLPGQDELKERPATAVEIGSHQHIGQQSIGILTAPQAKRRYPEEKESSNIKNLIKSASFANIAARFKPHPKKQFVTTDDGTSTNGATPKFRLAHCSNYPDNPGAHPHLALVPADSRNFFDQSAHATKPSDDVLYPQTTTPRVSPLIQSPTSPLIRPPSLESLRPRTRRSQCCPPGSPTVAVARNRNIRQSRRNAENAILKECGIIPNTLERRSLRSRSFYRPIHRDIFAPNPSLQSLRPISRDSAANRNLAVPIEVRLCRPSAAQPVRRLTAAPSSNESLTRGSCSAHPGLLCTSHGSPQNNCTPTVPDSSSGESSRYSDDQFVTPYGHSRSGSMTSHYSRAGFEGLVRGHALPDPFSPESARRQERRLDVHRELREYLQAS